MVVGLGKNGETLRGDAVWVSRIEQVLTTPRGARRKRRDFGAWVLSLLGRNITPSLLSLVQAFVIEAFHHPPNGLTQFVPSRVVASDAGGGRLTVLIVCPLGELVLGPDVWEGVV